jgi:hypothetical protein
MKSPQSVVVWTILARRWTFLASAFLLAALDRMIVSGKKG